MECSGQEGERSQLTFNLLWRRCTALVLRDQLIVFWQPKPQETRSLSATSLSCPGHVGCFCFGEHKRVSKPANQQTAESGLRNP